MEQNEITWTALEFEPHKKSPDWFWIFGIVIIFGAIISVVLGDTLFAIFIVLSGLVVGLYATKHPETLQCKIDKRGVTIQKEFYEFNKIDSFWIDESRENRTKLLMTLKNKLSMHIAVPINPEDSEIIREFLSNKTTEQHQRESITEQISEWLQI